MPRYNQRTSLFTFLSLIDAFMLLTATQENKTIRVTFAFGCEYFLEKNIKDFPSVSLFWHAWLVLELPNKDAPCTITVSKMETRQRNFIFSI